MKPLKIIGLEEHFITADAHKAWQALDPQWQDSAARHVMPHHPRAQPR